MEEFQISGIGNYYGGLHVSRDPETGKCFWGIQDWNDGVGWEPIPQALYDELEKYHIEEKAE